MDQQRKRLRRLSFEWLEPRAMLAANPLLVAPFPATGDPASLAAALLTSSPGLILVDDSAYFQGANDQAGFFSNLNVQDTAAGVRLSLPNGILLTTGSSTSATINDSTAASTINDGLGDPDLTALAGLDPSGHIIHTFDANSLQFQFTAAPNIQSMSLQFVFGSEEYPEFVGSRFNDVMGIYLDGRQLATNSSGHPINVNSNLLRLNNSGHASGTSAPGKTAVDFPTIQYDGLSRVLVLTAQLDPAVTNHTLKIAIADAGDATIDSAVFVAALTGSTQILSDGVTELIQQPTGSSPSPTSPPSLIPPPTSTIDSITTSTTASTNANTTTSEIPRSAAEAFRDRSEALNHAARLQTLRIESGGGGLVERAETSSARAAPTIATSNRPSDIALIAFAQRRSSGGDERIAAILMNLADVEEPRLLAIEFGDEVVKRETTTSKPVAAAPAADAATIAAVAAPSPVPADLPTQFSDWNVWWLMAVPVAATAAAAGWVYRHRLFGNMSTLLRRFGL